MKHSELRCAGFILFNKTLDKVLLIKDNRSKKWSPPKGNIEHFESTINAALREVKEETGITIELNSKLNSIRAGKAILFITSIDENIKKEDFDPIEIEKNEWWNLSDLYESVNFEPEMFNSIIRIICKKNKIFYRNKLRK